MTSKKLSRRLLLAAAALLVAGLTTLPAAAAPPSPSSPDFGAYVMAKIDDQYRGLKSHGIMKMHIKTEHWTRTLTAETWSLEKDYSLVRILKPRKEKGTATLKAKNDLFTYLNKTGRTIKITSGMMGGSWMGSHFTNDDLIRQTRLSRDFIIKKTHDGSDVYRFTCTPKPDAPVVWGKIVVTVRKSDLEPLKQVFYDEDGKKVRQMEFSNRRQIGTRTVAMKMVVRPLNGSGEHTEVTWEKLDFDVALSKSFFTLQKLKRM